MNNQFTASYSQEESSALLWCLLKCAIAGNIHKLTSTERQNLLSFYEQLQQVLPEIYTIDTSESPAPSLFPEGGHDD